MTRCGVRIQWRGCVQFRSCERPEKIRLKYVVHGTGMKNFLYWFVWRYEGWLSRQADPHGAVCCVVKRKLDCHVRLRMQSEVKVVKGREFVVAEFLGVLETFQSLQKVSPLQHWKNGA